jgi:endo-alpha-N-acetylgalactosaminidase
MLEKTLRFLGVLTVFFSACSAAPVLYASTNPAEPSSSESTAPNVAPTATGRADSAVTIESPQLAVSVDSKFPRVVRYIHKPSGAVLYGQDDTLSEVKINGQTETHRVSFSSTTDTAYYELTFPSIAIEIKLYLKVVGSVLELKVTDISEKGRVLLKTLELPDHSLVSVRSSQPAAHITAARVWPSTNSNEEFIPLAEKGLDSAAVPRTYVILNTSELAATIANNVLLDSNRLCYQTVDRGSYKKCGLWCPLWTWREVEAETVELPYAKVIITADRNQDGVVDWQDGAIAYRDIMVSPAGAESVPTRVVSQIAMNFASLAQHPFLRALDNIKKIYLYTDGLGQTVQFKGYQSEGHDSAHPDYGNHFNERAGGVKDLNFTVDQARKYDCLVGVHINPTEAYPEARYYNEKLVTARDGWQWLDESKLIDKRYDIISGGLYQRFDELKAAVPNLAWIYVDVYFGEGWDAWKLARKLHSNGWFIYTEFESMLERDAVWIHRSQEYADLGVKSKVIRFIRNQERDAWPRQELLRGSHNLGFMGWHAENDVPAFIRNVFTNNLPTKFMQHFKISKWADERIDFEDSVYAAKEAGRVNIYKDNRLVFSGIFNPQKRLTEDNKIFIPWPPRQEAKIYHWNDAGAESAWQLPASWSEVSKVKLYRLTDTGRVFAVDIAVQAGKVVINAEAGVPYVLYKSEPPGYPEIVWGEGGLVKDPGFDSHGFAYWAKSSSTGSTEHITITNDAKGQTHLRISGNNGADGAVSQKLAGLEPGRSYAASVWVELKGKRIATLGVKDYGGPEVTNYVRKTDVQNYSYCADKFNSYYQRLKVMFDVPQGQTTATLYLKADRGDADSIADFDDVRVLPAVRTDQKGHYLFEDFEHTDEGWGPFVFGLDSDTHSHLSELHEGYTNDTINGRFSLKTRNEIAGTVFRTTPALLRLEPNTTYTISFEYLQDNSEQFHVAVRTDDGGQPHEKLNVAISGNKGRFSRSFATDDFDDYYIAIIKSNGQPGVLVIDDFAIDLQKAEMN